jgi:hypothetical protein
MTNSSILENSVESPMANAKSNTASFEQLDNRLLESIRLHYHSNHQAEYLNLQAQVESLLTQLQQSGGNS